MEFDDFLEDKRRHRGNFREQRYHEDHDDNRYSHELYPAYHGHNGHQKWMTVLEKIRSNKKLKLAVAMAGMVIIVIAIVLIAAMLPLILKLFNYISQNGVQGIIGGVTEFLDKLWKGSGK